MAQILAMVWHRIGLEREVGFEKGVVQEVHLYSPGKKERNGGGGGEGKGGEPFFHIGH